MFPFRRGEKASVRSGLDDLFLRCAKGDEAAFAEFYGFVIARVYGVVRSVVRDPARSEEVSQEVMLELWRTAGRFSSQRGSAVGWALTIAHRRAVDCVRSEQSARNREQRVAAEPADPPTEDPQIATEGRLEAARVERAMSALSDAQREAVELAYFRGYSHSEIAASLDLPLGTVKTRIRDGLIRLRDELGVKT